MMQAKPFWNNSVTHASWEMLARLAKEFDIVVIGGWSVYLWTKAQKSKDIDVVVSFDTLNAMRKKFRLEKNARLHKYEVKTPEFDIDVYVAHYSKLALPSEKLLELATIVEGIKTVKPEALLLLKQKAEIERRHSVKGRKDEIDIFCILAYSGMNLAKYAELAKENGLAGYIGELRSAIRNIPDSDIAFTGLSFMEFKRSKKDFLEKIRKL